MLLLASLYLVLREKNKFLALIIFLLAGFIGLSTYNLNIKEALLPMLTGLFGSSSLITSIIKKKKIPKQKISKVKIRRRDFLNTILATSLASPLCSFLPALGSGQAAVISSDLIGERDKKQFLMLLGSINTIVMGLGIISLYSINVTRSGSAVAISQLLTNFTTLNLIIIIFTIILAGVFSFFIGLKLVRFFSLRVHKISYSKLSLFILFFLITVVIYFSGWMGLVVFLTSTFLGLFTILSNSRRTLLMGCLMLTSLVLYFPV
jgi:putative membrane protein